jgi:Methyltransferase TRM13
MHHCNATALNDLSIPSGLPHVACRVVSCRTLDCRSLRKEAALDMRRLVVDIKDFMPAGILSADGGAMPPWVAIGKHLCGAATDFTLRCCLQTQHGSCGVVEHEEGMRSSGAGRQPSAVEHEEGMRSSGAGRQPSAVEQDTGASSEEAGRGWPAAAAQRGATAAGLHEKPAARDASPPDTAAGGLRGIAVAPCCHHRCQWRHYVNQRFFLDLCFTPAEFELISWMTGASGLGTRVPWRQWGNWPAWSHLRGDARPKSIGCAWKKNCSLVRKGLTAIQPYVSCSALAAIHQRLCAPATAASTAMLPILTCAADTADALVLSTGWALCGHEAPAGQGAELCSEEEQQDNDEGLRPTVACCQRAAPAAPAAHGTGATAGRDPSPPADAIVAGRSAECPTDGAGCADNVTGGVGVVVEEPLKQREQELLGPVSCAGPPKRQKMDDDGGGGTCQAERGEARSDAWPEGSAPTAGIPRSERIVIGMICKRLIDWGRLAWLREHGYEAELVAYVAPSVSGENKLLLAAPRDRKREQCGALV